MRALRINMQFDARMSEVSAEVTQFAQAGATLAAAGVNVQELETQLVDEVICGDEVVPPPPTTLEVPASPPVDLGTG